MGRETNKQRRDRQAVSAREKAAVARTQQRQREQRRRALSILATVVVIAVAGVLIAVIAINSGSTKQSNDRQAASPAVLSTLTGVTPAALTTVAGGSTSAPSAKPANSGDAALTQGGKPDLLYIGGEFCPYCAAERWPLIQALSRFGTFTNLSEIHSATDDGNVATFSFYNSSYTSKYLVFSPVEAADRSEKPLETPSPTQEALFKEYGQGFPFLDFGGKYVQDAAGYAYTDLSGMSQAQIAAQFTDPSSKIAQDILGEANNITATICTLTNNAPAKVCGASQITAIQGKLSA